MNIDREKMCILKAAILRKMLPSKEIEKLYSCDYEFTIEGNEIIMLEIWNNPKGDHNYEDRYREYFKIKPIPVSIICE